MLHCILTLIYCITSCPFHFHFHTLSTMLLDTGDGFYGGHLPTQNRKRGTRRRSYWLRKLL